MRISRSAPKARMIINDKMGHFCVRHVLALENLSKLLKVDFSRAVFCNAKRGIDALAKAL